MIMTPAVHPGDGNVQKLYESKICTMFVQKLYKYCTKCWCQKLYKTCTIYCARVVQRTYKKFTGSVQTLCKTHTCLWTYVETQKDVYKQTDPDIGTLSGIVRCVSTLMIHFDPATGPGVWMVADSRSRRDPFHRVCVRYRGR